MLQKNELLSGALSYGATLVMFVVKHVSAEIICCDSFNEWYCISLSLMISFALAQVGESGKETTSSKDFRGFHGSSIPIWKFWDFFQ